MIDPQKILNSPETLTEQERLAVVEIIRWMHYILSEAAPVGKGQITAVKITHEAYKDIRRAFFV